MTGFSAQDTQSEEGNVQLPAHTASGLGCGRPMAAVCMNQYAPDSLISHRTTVADKQ